MQVHITVLWHVVVKHNVNSLYVHTTSKQVSSDQDTLLEVLELLVTGKSVLLTERSVYADGGEVLLTEELSEGHTSLYCTHKDNNLVELKQIQEIKQLSILLTLLEFDVVLLETVQSQLCLIIYKYFKSLVRGGCEMRLERN